MAIRKQGAGDLSSLTRKPVLQVHRMPTHVPEAWREPAEALFLPLDVCVCKCALDGAGEDREGSSYDGQPGSSVHTDFTAP